MTAGTYKIINKINKHFYYGSSIDIDRRWGEHKTRLRGGYHPNPHLQNAWNKYGEDVFEFRVEYEVSDPSHAVLIEDIVLCNFDCHYNIAPRATEVIFSEETRKKMSLAHLGEKNSMYGIRLTGDKNGFYGKHHTAETRKKLRDVWTDERRQNQSDAMSGENHPFFGKSLSEEHRANIAKASTGRRHTAKARRKISKSTSKENHPLWISLSEGTIKEMKRLYKNGYTYQQVADKFGLTYDTARRRILDINRSKYSKEI